MTAGPSADVSPHAKSVPTGSSLSLSWLQVVGVILFFVLIGHIWSIDAGLYLDDHAHYGHLSRDDWSFRSAVEASRLGIVGEVMDLWGRREAGLRFFRPIAFWIMKAQYTLVGWKPMGMHLFSLAWHLACCLLVAGVTFQALRSRFWAAFAGSLMAIHPGHVATVYWVACQTEIMTTAFLLTGILAYGRHACWPVPWLSPVRPGPELGSATAAPGSSTGLTSATTDPGRTPILTIWIMVAIISYALALGCRENAILFPAACWAGDRLLGTPRRRWIRWEHVAMALVGAGYLVLRWQMLGGFPLPAKPYLMPITDPEFPKYALDKISIYAMALFLFVPVVPIGGRMFFVRHPGWLYGGLGVVVLFVLVVWLAYRRSWRMLWPVVWMGCFFAAVIPVFASSHHLYLPGLGMVLILTAGLAALAGHWRQACHRVPRWRRWSCRGFVGTLAIGLTLVTWALGFTFNRGTIVEDILIDDVIHRGRSIRDGDHLYFINMPVIAYYAIPAIKAQLGLETLYGHVLTFSPYLMRMESPGSVTFADDRRLCVRSPEDARYLQGVTGQMLLGAMDLADALLVEGQPLDAGAFTVTPTAVDAAGFRELQFTFQEPFDTAGCHFFFGSPDFLAYPLDVPARLSER